MLDLQQKYLGMITGSAQLGANMQYLHGHTRICSNEQRAVMIVSDIVPLDLLQLLLGQSYDLFSSRHV